MSQEALYYYAVLGLTKDATDAEVKQAYRRLASKYHPDRGGDPAMMAEINKAYRVLSDPELRAKYDAGESTEEAADPREGRIREEFKRLYIHCKNLPGCKPQWIPFFMMDELVRVGEQIREKVEKLRASIKQEEAFLDVWETEDGEEATYLRDAQASILAELKTELEGVLTARWMCKELTRRVEKTKHKSEPKGYKDWKMRQEMKTNQNPRGIGALDAAIAELMKEHFPYHGTGGTGGTRFP